jgi:hypothetical protein
MAPRCADFVYHARVQLICVCCTPACAEQREWLCSVPHAHTAGNARVVIVIVIVVVVVCISRSGDSSIVVFAAQKICVIGATARATLIAADAKGLVADVKLVLILYCKLYVAGTACGACAHASHTRCREAVGGTVIEGAAKAAWRVGR